MILMPRRLSKLRIFGLFIGRWVRYLSRMDQTTYEAFYDEVQKIAESDLATYEEKAKGMTHLTPGETVGPGFGASLGASLGALGGGIYGGYTGKSPLNRLWRAGSGAVEGGFLGGSAGLLAGIGVGRLVDKLRGVKGTPYTPDEQRAYALSSALQDYDAPMAANHDWDNPEGLTPEEAATHKRMRGYEKEHRALTGKSPW
jgi:hypothetical protein